MVSAEILNSHPVSTLKKEISKTNIKGYSRMKKPELVATMMKHKERFGHIKHSGKGKAEPKKKIPFKVKEKKPATPKPSADLENKMFKGGFEKNKSKMFSVLIAPARNPKKDLSTFKAEFASKGFIKKQEDNQTSGNLKDLAENVKEGLINSFSSLLADLRAVDAPYSKYVKQYYE